MNSLARVARVTMPFTVVAPSRLKFCERRLAFCVRKEIESGRECLLNNFALLFDSSPRKLLWHDCDVMFRVQIYIVAFVTFERFPKIDSFKVYNIRPNFPRATELFDHQTSYSYVVLSNVCQNTSIFHVTNAIMCEFASRFQPRCKCMSESGQLSTHKGGISENTMSYQIQQNASA